MTIEQLNVLNAEFKQLEELKKIIRRYKDDRLVFGVRVDGFSVDNEILNKITKKYAIYVIEELKEEIKKRETELDSLSILQLNKIV